MENHDTLKELFLRYLDNRCSPEEVRFLLEHFKLEKESSRLRELIEDQLASPVSPHFEESPEGQALFERVHQNIHKTIGKKSETTGTRRLWPRVAAAAAVIVLLGLSWTYRVQLMNMVDPIEIEYAMTQTGEREEVLLADGSKVWLAPESSLEYPEAFRGKTREVILKGEAFFEIESDKEHPFIIRSREVSTQVLGTSFNVKAHEQEDVAVTVVTGSVRVAVDREDTENITSVDLKPEQRAVFKKDEELLIKEEAPDALAMLDRRVGVFHYQGTSVRDILYDMAREYQVQIQAEGVFDRCTFYGTKRPEDEVFRFLEKVALTVNAKVRQEGDTIHFTGTDCK